MCFAAIGLIGGLVSAAGSVMSGMMQAQGYEAQAAAYKAQAQTQAMAGSAAGQQADDKMKRMTGAQVTALASNGLDLSGSALDVIRDSRAQAEMDKATIRANWQNQANVSTFQSNVATMNAGNAMMGGIIGAAAPLINSFRPNTGLYGAYGSGGFGFG